MTPLVQIQKNSPMKSHIAAVTSVELRRKCACGSHPIAGGECADCHKEKPILQRQAISPARASVPAIVHEVLNSPGQPLDAKTRAFMEPRFGHDFSDVRLHTDTKAGESSRAVNALAYTVGNDVVFGSGRYTPGTQAGLRLLAHELTHTLQQRGTALQPSLEIGRVDDPGEVEADSVADAVVNSRDPVPGIRGGGPGLLRRTPDEPKPLQTDIAHLPVSGHGDKARIHVIRKMMPCECRNVPDVREGVFYNPNMNALAIAYRHCSGGTTADVYGEVQSNLSSFLAGGTPPTGTARIGFEINVVGRIVGGRAVLEVLGSNVAGGQGVGGRAQVVFQGNQWRVFVTADFLHGLGANSGDVLQLNLGARLGPITAEVQVANALSSTPSGTGAGCVDVFGTSARLCLTIAGGGGSGTTGGLELRGSLPGPQVHQERCFQCLCPPPRKHFECYLDIPPTDTPVTREIDVQNPHEHRFYFRLDRTLPSEDSALRARGTASIDAVASEVAAGGAVLTIFGYASPEATEAHNQTLSADRAATLTGLLRSRLPAGTPLPSPIAGGELLGRRPAPVPTSQLGDAIHTAGFRSAEDISVLLLGEEITRPELSDQFVSLFRALTDPADRLAFFGLDPGDPLASQVLGSVDQFLLRPHAGTRPWEHIFRLLRVGVIRTQTPERRSVTETEHTTGSLSPIAEDECNARGGEAERRGLLPPLPSEMKTPHRELADRQVECLIEVSSEDRRGGCSYEIPPNMRLSPTAPRRAPRQFP
jgi:hypothetical protein